MMIQRPPKPTRIVLLALAMAALLSPAPVVAEPGESAINSILRIEHRQLDEVDLSGGALDGRVRTESDLEERQSESRLDLRVILVPPPRGHPEWEDPRFSLSSAEVRRLRQLVDYVQHNLDDLKEDLECRTEFLVRFECGFEVVYYLEPDPEGPSLRSYITLPGGERSRSASADELSRFIEHADDIMTEQRDGG